MTCYGKLSTGTAIYTPHRTAVVVVLYICRQECRTHMTPHTATNMAARVHIVQGLLHAGTTTRRPYPEPRCLMRGYLAHTAVGKTPIEFDVLRTVLDATGESATSPNIPLTMFKTSLPTKPRPAPTREDWFEIIPSEEKKKSPWSPPFRG